MTKKAAAPEELGPDETPTAPKEQKREITKEPTKGGLYTEEGEPLATPLPEPDEHRMKKPER